ncbi:hypothetical protein GGQ84_000949 [Desulfitispora alkaliphila]|uniref:hypothetical protein n=1 Tax=Desulfitispora alkaliphila TaxID=622674 RepID=UPI003D211AFB
MELFLHILWITWIVVFIPTHLSLSIFVYQDAQRRQVFALRGTSPVLWFCVSFSLPIIGMFVYWVMHYSSLAVWKTVQKQDYYD